MNHRVSSVLFVKCGERAPIERGRGKYNAESNGAEQEPSAIPCEVKLPADRNVRLIAIQMYV